MRRRVVIGIAAVLLTIGGGNALAQPGGHGPPFENPDHPAWFGLCTAYGNNADQAKQAPPFAALEELAEGDVEAFCGDRTPGNSGNAQGGRP